MNFTQPDWVPYPCRCLCLGFAEQTTITLPLRRMILHLSHIRLIEERTFIFSPQTQKIMLPGKSMLDDKTAQHHL
jgi:hypothetical protein